ncbi:MAG: penicillin-binding protein 2 [Legionellaceae bacterium]|nr:penicillin-binding protein 2 [Legionellaceae bacterium]
MIKYRKAKSRVSDQNRVFVQNFRLVVMAALLIVLSLMLILRIAYLQFSQFQRYATLSLKNQMSIIPIPPPRGLIYDRNGVILAENVPIYVLEVIPERVKDLKKTLAQLQDILPSISTDDIEKFYLTKKQNHAYDPVPLKLKLSQEEVAIFASDQYKFPGVNIKALSMRYYPLGETTAHLLGYVGRINTSDLQKVDSQNYRSTNFIGKSGVEKFYETKLHGSVGYQQIETNVNGRTIRTLNKQPPKPGANINLTIDSRLQKSSFDALQGFRGAAILMSVSGGEILSMTSSPSFDPNLFVNGISNSDYKLLSNEIDRPLYNRAVRGLYPPASTIKPFVALTGLDKKFIDVNSWIYDPGWYKLPNVKRSYRCWRHSGHGITNVKKAIIVSCDTFFYQLSNKMGINVIEEMLSQFGFGQLSNVDLNEEAGGVIPSPYWKKQRKGVSWYPGDTLITGIGQGFMLATPLQLANATAALSQNGRRFRPHLLASSVYNSNKTVKYKSIEEYPIKLKDKNNWSIITDAMHMVITKNEGTGRRFGRDAPYSVAAKTGTAQVFTLSQDTKKNYENIPVKLRDHSLFIAFAPVENPKVAIAVLIENDENAPLVARRILDSYFKLYPEKSTNITMKTHKSQS